MNSFSKVLFWIFTIILGFVNPLISVVLVILYYLPAILEDLGKSCKEKETEKNPFSEDVLEEMK